MSEKLLEERQKTHGDWDDFAAILQELRLINERYSFDGGSTGQKVALDMILFKLARIINGGWDHKDNWDDIAGYAKLGGGWKSEQLRKDAIWDAGTASTIDLSDKGSRLPAPERSER